MKLIIAFVVVIAVCIAEKTRWHQLNNHYTFETYVSEYHKTYSSSEEYNSRKAIFEARLRSVIAHNQDSTKTWKNGINHLSDRTPEEFRKLLGYKKSIAFSTKVSSKDILSETLMPASSLPTKIDWRSKGLVSPVKDQGQCGSCWTFATAETIESHWAMAKGDLSDLSEQQLLDCTPNPNHCGGTGGCGGGTAELAYAQIMAMGGLSSEWTYPYISYYGAASGCNFNQSTTVPMVQLSGFKVLPSNQYLPLLNAVVNHGPIAITVDASAWSEYEQGVFDGCNQTNPDLDHAVQLVGYGTDVDLGDYWLVRNSWSPVWGESGYIRIARSEKVQCGTDINPSDGTGCSNGPAEVTVCGTCGLLYDSSFPTIVK